MSVPRWNNKDSGNHSSFYLLADASSGETVLSRNISQKKLGTSPIQNQIDGLVSGFISQASDWKSLTAITAGGFAYRWGKISVLGVGAIRESPLLARPLSIAFGLGSEVTAFEFTQRTLTSLSSPLTSHSSPNLWSWTGPGGWKEGLLNSLITFGTLKGFGTLSQGQNIILQHGFQDAGMVAGHQLTYLAGIGPKPEGSLAEQFAHAEVTNLQIGAGLSLGHALTGGRILAIEKVLDLSFSMKTPSRILRFHQGSVSQSETQRSFEPAQGEWSGVEMASSALERFKKITPMQMSPADKKKDPTLTKTASMLTRKSQGGPRRKTGKSRRFQFDPREPRFTNEDTNLQLKEEMAQYGDYLQHLIEIFMKVPAGHFGEEVRYELCPEGGIGMFEKDTTGGGAYYRLRGVYLEEDLIDALFAKKELLFALYPALVAHEISHDLEYDGTRFKEWYERLNFQFYPPGEFEYHLSELQVDENAMELLRRLPFEIPLYQGRDPLSLSFIVLSEIELQRFRQFDDEGRLSEIMGSEDLQPKMFLKFARNLARLLYVVSRDGTEANQWLPRIKSWRVEVHQFLQRFSNYSNSQFEGLTQLFLEFLAAQRPEITIEDWRAK